MIRDPDTAALYWTQLRQKGGVMTDPRRLRVGDEVTVSGWGNCCGLDQDYHELPGVVVSDGDRVTVRVDAFRILPAGFWHDPRVKFDVNLIRSVYKYN